jgi:hypothetical protein
MYFSCSSQGESRRLADLTPRRCNGCLKKLPWQSLTDIYFLELDSLASPGRITCDDNSSLHSPVIRYGRQTLVQTRRLSRTRNDCANLSQDMKNLCFVINIHACLYGNGLQCKTVKYSACPKIYNARSFLKDNGCAATAAKTGGS